MSELLIQALSSPTRARTIWLEYQNGNTQGLTEHDINQIETRWAMFVPNWENDAPIDYTEYDIDDGTYDGLVEESVNESGEETGLDNVRANKTGRWVNTGITAGLSVGSGVCALAAKDGTQGLFQMSENQAGFGECAGQNTMAYVAIGLAVVNLAKYHITKPNKEAHDACIEMQEIISTEQELTATAQDNMMRMEEEAISASDEATYLNEQANNVFLVQKAEFDFEARSLESLQKKANTRGGLTQEEQDLYRSLATEADATSGIVTQVRENTTSEVDALYSELGGFQEEFDNSVETIANLEGMTDYAASFDESTVKTCKWENIGQYTNAGSATIAAGKLMATGMWWNYLVAAVGFGTAVGSMFAANEQSNMKLDVEGTIANRQNAQLVGTDALSVYDSAIVGYGSAIDNFENLEMFVPNEVESSYSEETPEKADEENEDEE